MGRLDELLIFDDACSVTMFEMHVQMHRDGRERGLWVRLQDTCEARAATYKTWLNDTVNLVARMFGFDEDKSKKFSLFMTMHSEIGRLLNSKVEEAALLEWSQVLRMYNAIGDQLRARGQLSPRQTLTGRRLEDGARALALPALPESVTKAEIERQLEILYQGMVALQSLDDLGSEEANAKAWSDMETLQARFDALSVKLKAME